MKIPENFIHLMIRDGAPITNDPKDCDNHCRIAYYSGDRFRTDWKTANTFLENLKQYGIDYEKCYGWQDGSEDGFDGTDSDGITNNFIECIIVLNDGTEQKFCVKPPYDMGASQLAILLTNPIELDDAIESLTNKVNCKKSKREYFKYQDYCIQISIK